MKIIGFFSAVLLLCLTTDLYSQNGNGTNIYSELLNTSDSLYNIRKFNEAIERSTYLLNLINKNSNPDAKNICRAHQIIGSSYESLGKYDKAAEHYRFGINFAEKASDTSELSEFHCNLGGVMVYLGKYNEAMENFNKSLKYDKTIKNEDGISSNLNSIAKIYEMWHKYDDAIECYKQSLEIEKKNRKDPRIAIRLSGLASAYRLKGDYDKALYYQMAALDIEKKLKNNYKIAVRYDLLGEIYQSKKEYDKAEKYFIAALELLNKTDKNNSEQNDNRTYLSCAIILNHLGRINFLQGHLSKAIDYYRQSIDIAFKINYHLMILKTSKELSDLYAKTGNYKDAYKYLEVYRTNKDSAFTAENQKIIAEFREKYETEKKEKEIAVLNGDKILTLNKLQQVTQQKNYFVLLIIAVILLALLIYNKYRYKKKTNIELELKNKELEEINESKNKFLSIISHDLKSPISSFQRITEAINNSFEDIDKDTLKIFIYDMNESAKGLNIFLKNLLNWVMSQSGRIAPQKINFDLKQICSETTQNIQYLADERNIALKTNTASGVIVYADREMIQTALRNILTNAIKFSDDNSKVIINIFQDDKYSKITVTNSGPGITPEEISLLFRIDKDPLKIGNHSGKGFGMGLIISNELLKQNGGFIKLENGAPEKTIFSINIPVISEK